MYQAYKNIFDRLQLQYRIVQADAGNIGGSQTHEFQLLAAAGEDSLLVSDSSDFAANVEVCPAIDFDDTVTSREVECEIQKFPTPGLKTIDDLSKSLKLSQQELVKTLFYSANDGSDSSEKGLKPLAVLLRGADELNPVKLKNVLGLSNPPSMLTDEEVLAVTGAKPGSCGPVGLNIPVYVDHGVAKLKNFIVGANEDGYHFKNVNLGRDFKPHKVADLRMAREGDRCPQSHGRLKAFRGIEVGHVFYLGKKYSQKMNASFLDQNGKAQFFEMGCYGIGVSRTIQAAIEQCHDQDGIIWPRAIAPFDVHLCLLDPKDVETFKVAEKIYFELRSQGIDVLLDDRDERPGIKFKDADLLGMPFRINLGKKGLEMNTAEVILRKTKEQFKLSPSEIVSKITTLLQLSK
jgi:prolyl-tRNA synthetase